MTTFRARPIPHGQPWSCVLKLRAREGSPILDLTGAALVCTFRTGRGSTTPLLKLTGAGLTLIATDEVRIQLTAAQTRLLPVGGIIFALGRSDGGLRDLTPAIQWPVRAPVNQEAP